MLTPSDIKAISDLIVQQSFKTPSFWLAIGILVILLWDKLYYFKKAKENYEDAIKSLKERCEAEKAKLKADFASEKAELILKHVEKQMRSIRYGPELLNEVIYDNEKITKNDKEKEFHRIVAAGMHYENISRHDLAIDCFEDALGTKPDDIGLHLALGVIYGEKIGTPEGKEKAIEHCKRAIEIDKNNVSGWFNLAVYTNHLKKAPESLPIYLKAEQLIISQGLQNTETEGKLNIFIGHDYKDTGKKEDAKIRYNKAIAILQKLTSAGNMSAAFWLENAEVNLRKLIEDIEKK